MASLGSAGTQEMSSRCQRKSVRVRQMRWSKRDRLGSNWLYRIGWDGVERLGSDGVEVEGPWSWRVDVRDW